MPEEIIIQAITSSGKDASHPEEIIHLPLFNIEPNQDSLVAYNFKKSALRRKTALITAFSAQPVRQIILSSEKH